MRSLGNNPSILLMDEPLSQLDNNLKEDIRNELMIIFEKFEITVLIATHDIEDALYMSDKTIILNKGKLQQFDNLVNIYKYPNSEYSALLFGNSNIIPRDYIPSAKHHFYKHSINKEVVSIRPEQFVINTDRVNDNTLSIDCEIKDIIDMGFKYIIKMIRFAKYFIIYLFLVSCGFQSIYVSDKSDFSFNKYSQFLNDIKLLF